MKTGPPTAMITLVGMPGGGKSTVGRHLARQLGWAFVDSDSEIEKRIGCSVREFFDREGEDAFRDIEQKVIAELTSRSQAAGLVLATGGGAVLRRVNRENMRHGGTVVYLRCAPE